VSKKKKKKRKTYMGPKHHTLAFGPIVCPLAVAVFGVLKGEGAVAMELKGWVVVGG
jgi:hypothetical protein